MNTRYFAMAAGLSLLAGSAYGIDVELRDSAFVNREGARVGKPGHMDFHFHHVFESGNASSANIRMGTAITDGFTAYITSRYHSIDTGDTEASDYEVDLSARAALMAETQDAVIDLALIIGGSSLREDFSDMSGSSTDTRQFYRASLVVGRSLCQNAYIAVGPDVVYHDDEDDTTTAVTLLARVGWPSIGLVGEWSSLSDNPLDWDDPWAIGLQSVMGPHLLTLFVSNVSGLTTSRLLQGDDRKTFFGFRFTL